MRTKRNKWDSGPSAPQDAATPEALRKKAQEAAAKLMAQRQHEQAMCEDIIINDHPINIRDQLTRRAALVPVEQQTGTSIIVKGRYYPPGAPRAPNSPPLLLHITAAQHVVMDEHAKRIAVSRAAAHIHAILRGQATPISPVPPYPGNRPLAPPPDMVCRPDGQLPVRPGMHMHMGVQMPPPGYMGGHPGVPQHPMHATATQAPPGAPMGMLGPNPHLQGMPGAQPRPGHAQAVPAQFMPSSLPPHVAPPPHQQLYAQAPVDPVAHMQAASPHLSTQTQPPFYGQPAQQAQPPRPSSSILADTAPGRLVAPGGVADPTSGHSHTSSAGPKGAPPRPHGPSSGPLPSQEQAGSSCTVPIDFSGQPGFDVVQRLRGPGNSYISHIERETGATIELRGLGSGSHARTDQPLHVFIHHHDPWRRKPAEDLIHSLLQTVRSAASASAVAHPSAPQPHAPQTMYPLGPATDSNAPSSAQAPQGAWAGGSSGPGESTAWPAYRHQPQPVHHQAAAFSGQFAMQQGMVAASAPVHPGTAEPDPHHQFQRSEPVKSGIESVAAAPPGIQANSALPSSNAVGSHAGPASGEGAAAGRTATRNENGQDARQPPKRKFREFKEESRSTQNRAIALPSYYKHLADDTEGATVDAGAGDRDRSGELVFGPYGPPEGHAARAGLGARRQDNSSATEHGHAPHVQQPPVGFLVPYDED